jgi:hypothetical protein
MSKFMTDEGVHGYDSKLNGNIDYLLLYIILISSVFIAVAPIFTIAYIIRLKSQRQNLSEETYNLCWMLFSALTFEGYIAVLFLAMPYFSIAIWIVVFQQNISAKTFAIIYAANTMQSSLDAIVILGFVRPYRNFILRFFKNSFKKGWKKLVSGQGSASNNEEKRSILLL